MPKLSAAEVARLTGGWIVGDAGATAASLIADSREVTAASAFAAVRGGHGFVGQAVQAGASFVLVERAEVVPSGATAVIVPDVVAALGALASDRVSRLGARVVGITGSTGKTLTKDFVAAALGSDVYASPGSFNTDVGLPLAILACPDGPRVLVAELGARHAGEIATLARIVRPEIAVVTGIGVTHLGEFGSREAIARTKSELLSALPADGRAIVPSTDDFLALLVSSTAARVVTVGPGGHVRYGARAVDRSGRTHGWVDVGAERVDVSLPLPGRALMRNAAFAITVARALGVPAHEAAARLGRAGTTAWRMEIVPTDDLVIVNDAWNANPTSVASALRTTRELAGSGPAWAVLGGMAELGDIAVREHVRMGRLAAALGYSGIVALGDAAAGIAEGAGVIARRASSPHEAAEIVAAQAEAGSHVLVKASRVVGLYASFPSLLEQTRRRVRS